MNNLVIKLRYKLVIYTFVSLLLFVGATIDSYTNNSKLIWRNVLAVGITLAVLSTEIVDLVQDLRAKRERGRLEEEEEELFE